MSNVNNYDIKQAADQARKEKFIQIVGEADHVICADCGCGTFTQALFVKKVSGILIGSGVDLLHPMAVYMCSACGRILTGEGEVSTVKVEDFNENYGRALLDEEKTELEKEFEKSMSTEEVAENPVTPIISSIITSETENKPSQLIL